MSSNTLPAIRCGFIGLGSLGAPIARRMCLTPPCVMLAARYFVMLNRRANAAARTKGIAL